MADPTLVTAADIARIAGVSRGTVSNWRRRRPDFPEPAGGTEASPAYDRAEVEKWLADRGMLPELPPAEKLWRAVTEPLGSGDLGESVLRMARDEKALGDYGMETREALDVLLDRYADAAGISVTPAPVADLMAEIAGPAGGPALDLACGTGELLAAAQRHGVAEVYGQELDGALAELARIRLSAGKARTEISVGDSLRDDAFPGLAVDAVLCHPPFGEKDWGQEELVHDLRWQFGTPPKNEPELAWVQAAVAHLKPGGRAVMLLPPAVAVRPSARKIRAELVRHGVIRAIVSLPAGAVRPQHVPVHLWILEPPVVGADLRVLFVDAGQKPDEDTADLVLAAWNQFTQENSEEQPGVVRAIDLLDDDVDLSPARHSATSADSLNPAEMARLITELQKAVRQAMAQHTCHPWPEPENEPRWRMVTIADLDRSKAVTLYRGTTKPEPVTLKPGDVTIPVSAPGPVARGSVVTESEAGQPLPENVHLIRPDTDRIDPWFLAGFLVARVSVRAALTGTNGDRIDARRLKVPILPLEEQREYGRAFRELQDEQDRANRIASLTSELTELTRHALTEGAILPRSGQNA